MTKKINEEILPSVNKKIKRVPVVIKNLWEVGLTKGKLLEILDGVPNDTPIITEGFDHTYDHLNSKIRITSALFDSTNETINEDFGEELTPESKYGKRKQVIVII